MPNWVRNVVTVSKDTMNKIKEKYFENGILDFNKIIPIPKTLELTEGSITDVAIYYALLQKNENKQYEIIKALSKKEDYIYNNYWNKIKHYKSNGDFKDIYQKAKKFIPDEEARKLNITSLEQLGDTYINNIIKYGSTTWYDWCIENWGTKWGVSEFSCNETTMIFDTAWATPEPIFEKISKELPNALIEVQYADECYSNYNNGILILKDGLEDHKEELDEDFAAEVWSKIIKDEREQKDITDEMFD
ncbi:hypothetical protein [uncultured Clostridium sp.]|uniref:DUF1281 family ferredoxin-like fold protein n=1 Tax=uncultured Clostridium sp. TaxID=59620 RepID=UPI002634C93C|nr:hypothetical protein [uncultured Clostridium sp.]